MKANSGKNHLLMSGRETTHANVGGSTIKSSQKEILLEILYLQHVGFIQWTTQNSLHRNGGIPLSDSLMNVWTNVCVFASLFTLIWEILSGKIAFPAQWQSWRQLALCYYCRGYTKIFLCKWVILSQL